MTLCNRLSDRMPSVALGQSAWSAPEAEHLAACRDCGAEWRLVRGASRLGLAVEQRMDPAALAASVSERMRRDANRPRTSAPRLPSLVRWVAVAAAAAVLVFTVYRARVQDGPAPAVVEQALLPELEGLAADDLQLVLEMLPAEALVREGVVGTGDLNENELRSLLRFLEG